MLVHPQGPLIGSEVAEEAVGMGCATGRTGGGEAVDESAKDVARGVQVAVVGYGKAGNGGGIAAHGFAFPGRPWI